MKKLKKGSERIFYINLNDTLFNRLIKKVYWFKLYIRFKVFSIYKHMEEFIDSDRSSVMSMGSDIDVPEDPV